MTLHIDPREYPWLNGNGRGWSATPGHAHQEYESAPAAAGRGTVIGMEPPAAPQVEILPLVNIHAEPIAWLMSDWLAFGACAVLDGDPGLAKSTLTLDIAARASRGWLMPPAPSGLPGPLDPMGVLLLSAEDHLQQTIRPRLEVAGADLNLIWSLRGIRQGDSFHAPVIPFDLTQGPAHAAIASGRIRLVIIDPLAAFLSGEYDMHRDQDVRRALALLQSLAEEHNLVLLLVRHLNKLTGGPALYRGGGSIGISGSARSSLLVGRDPDPQEEDVRVLTMNKTNLGPLPRSLRYRVVPTPTPVGPHIRMKWLGECDLRPEDVLWQPQGRGRPDEEIHQAVDFLRSTLTAAGGRLAAAEARRLASEQGIGERTLRRASVFLRIVVRREGLPYFWSLPGLPTASGTQNSAGQNSAEQNSGQQNAHSELQTDLLDLNPFRAEVDGRE